MSAPLRLCLIGNSHLAAIKLGWQLLASKHPDVVPTFFGSPRNSLRELHWQGAALVCRSEPVKHNLQMTSGGLSEIDLRNFDAVLLCGLGFGLRQLARVYISHRHMGLGNWPDAVQRVSRACFQDAVSGQMRQTLASRLGHLIRERTAVPLLLVPTPMPVDTLLEGGDQDIIECWRPMIDSGDPSVLIAEYQRACAALVPPFSGILQQPEATLASPVTTHPSFQHGAVRLTEGLNERQPEGDVSHMNAAYGAQVLQLALAEINRLTAATEPA